GWVREAADAGAYLQPDVHRPGECAEVHGKREALSVVRLGRQGVACERGEACGAGAGRGRDRSGRAVSISTGDAGWQRSDGGSVSGCELQDAAVYSLVSRGASLVSRGASMANCGSVAGVAGLGASI